MRLKINKEDKEKIKSILENLEVVKIDINMDININILPKLKPKELKDGVIDITGRLISPFKKRKVKKEEEKVGEKDVKK